jgi:type IV pilus assembly protein PilA
MARTPSRSNRSRGRRLSLVELAIGVALAGSMLAVVVPTFAREIHASRSVEPVDGLHRVGVAAVAYAADRPVAEAFPPPVGLTPPVVPRGRCEADPPALWQQPTWQALAFTPAPEGSPHCFAFSFDSGRSPARSTFRAQAHGDLDGDGITSTFEITGHDVAGDPAGAVVDPGMYIDSEVE